LRKYVDVEDKLTRQIGGTGQRRNMTLINESGLYSLILSSKLDSAKSDFKSATSFIDEPQTIITASGVGAV
jgi:prophage antirepressor-like protein